VLWLINYKVIIVFEENNHEQVSKVMRMYNIVIIVIRYFNVIDALLLNISYNNLWYNIRWDYRIARRNYRQTCAISYNTIFINNHSKKTVLHETTTPTSN